MGVGNGKVAKGESYLYVAVYENVSNMLTHTLSSQSHPRSSTQQNETPSEAAMLASRDLTAMLMDRWVASTERKVAFKNQASSRMCRLRLCESHELTSFL
jgi:hypothetical protein